MVYYIDINKVSGEYVVKNNFLDFIWVTAVRFVEMTVSFIALSAVMYLVCYTDRFVNYQIFMACAAVCIVAYGILIFVLSRRCCLELCSYPMYYISNITSFLMLGGSAFALGHFCGFGSELFRWLASLSISPSWLIGGNISYLAVFAIFFGYVLFCVVLSPLGLSDDIEVVLEERMYGNDE